MARHPMSVLYEDNHLLAVLKPAQLPTMGVSADKPCLLKLARQYIKRKYNKPGNVYLGTVSRLDAPVTGVVVFARTSKAAARLNEAFRRREVEKIYWAIVEGRPSPRGRYTDWLVKDERHRKMHRVDPSHPGASEARLAYKCTKRIQGGSFVEIELETGRKHQIRLQFGDRGHAILGDRKYGGRAGDFPRGIALHARRLTLTHPVRRDCLELVAPLPASWGEFDVP